MKRIALLIGLATGLSTQLVTGETLRLKLEPERDWLLAGSPQEVVVKIDLSAVGKKPHHRRTPLNLAVVLDRSGSMAGAKIEKARQGAMDVLDQLAPGDIFSLVTYSDQAEVVFCAQEVEDREVLKSRITRIHAGGSTALYAGVQLGADQLSRHLSAKRINRIILLSDGLANVGPSSPAELRRLGHALSERGISVTTIGVGDDYNEDLMAGLAEASDANYYYVNDAEKLPGIFAKELGELQCVAVRDVRIEIILPDGIKPLGFIGRSERFEGQRAEVRLSQFTPEQSRYVFLRCQVEKPTPELAQVRVSYADELNGGSKEFIKDSVRVRFTEDKEQVARSVRPEITAQKELLLTAVAKDIALADADKGNYDLAAQRLSRQAVLLDSQYQNAPAPLQSAIKLEIENLNLRANELQQRQYSSGTRKAIQSESWNFRNAK